MGALIDVVGTLFVLGFFLLFPYLVFLVLAGFALDNRYQDSVEENLRTQFLELPAGPVVFGIRRSYLARPRLVALHLGEDACTAFFLNGSQMDLAGLNTRCWRLRSQVRLMQDAPRSLQLHRSPRNRWLKFGMDLLPVSEATLPPWASSEQMLVLENGIFRSRAVS